MSIFHGTKSADVLICSDQADRIDARDGNDIVYAGAGNDRINGHGGNDDLWGGLGDDTFIYGPIRTAGRDTIHDWNVGDVIDMPGTYDPAGTQLVITQDGADAVISCHGKVLITVLGVNVADLHLI